MSERGRAGRLVAFEGPDGAGKSTVIAMVADALREAGQAVVLPRVGKEHASRPTRTIRELTRDRRNLDLAARAEMLLYCAREAQVLDEVVRSALAAGETVLVDRSLLTPVVLGRARGLARDVCEQAAAVAAAGLEPDLTLVFDVHPRTARIRKRVARVRGHTIEEGGRKGLLGSAFKERVRRLYLEIAAERGYPVLHCERATPETIAERVLRIIERGPGAAEESELDRLPQWQVPADWDLAKALALMPVPVALFLANGLVSARALRAAAAGNEPALAAWSMDPEDPLRDRLVEVEPEYALRAWGGRPLSGPDDLRLRWLDRAPAACIGALKHLRDSRADEIRERYVEREPDAVLASLGAREDAEASKLRERAWEGGSDRARAASLAFCAGEGAWRLREALFRRSPVLGIEALRGVVDPRGQAWLDHYAEAAPKAVLECISGRADAHAHTLREQLFETGREVIDSVRGLGDERSWALRERGVERWPSTVAHSLLGLDADPRSARLAARCGELADGDTHVWRRLQGLAERPAWPAWARARSGSAAVGMDALDD